MNVIVDCDAGADDALALLLLLAAEAKGKLNLLAITCVTGNTSVENVCINVLRTLKAANRLDVPVYRGAQGPLIFTEDIKHLKPYYGKNGFGDADFSDEPDTSKIREENAIQFLHRTVTDSQGEITLVCLGPLTNIALAIRTYSDFARSVKDIFILGGNVRGIGNTSSAAEFNFYWDPEAAEIVLSSMQCSVTLVPWETSLAAHFSMDWRLNVLGKQKTPQVTLLNKVEYAMQQKYKNREKWGASDPLAVAALIEPDIISAKYNCHMSVELHGHGTRGQSVVDHLQKNDSNVTVVESVDIEKFKKVLLEAAKMENFKKPTS